jgi:hypothetical protein
MSHGNPCFAYLSLSTNITLYIFLFDQVAVLNEVQTLDKLGRNQNGKMDGQKIRQDRRVQRDSHK